MDDITTVLCKRPFPSDKKCKKEYKLLGNGISWYILLYKNNGLLHTTEAIPSQMIVIRFHISFTRVKKAGHMKLLTCLHVVEK